LLQEMIDAEHARRLTRDIGTIRSKGKYQKIEF
jgi:hypothetical protein